MRTVKLLQFLTTFLISLLVSAETTQITIQVTIGYTDSFIISGQEINLIDANHAHRYRMYINGQPFHDFAPIDSSNTIIENSSSSTTVSYTGQIPCDNTNQLLFQVELISDIDLDSEFDDHTSVRSLDYPHKINCSNVPQNFRLVF